MGYTPYVQYIVQYSVSMHIGRRPIGVPLSSFDGISRPLTPPPMSGRKSRFEFFANLLAVLCRSAIVAVLIETLVYCMCVQCTVCTD